MNEIKIVRCPEELIDYYTTILGVLKHINPNPNCEGNIIYNNYGIHGRHMESRHIDDHTAQISYNEKIMQAGDVSILDCLYSIDQYEIKYETAY